MWVFQSAPVIASPSQHHYSSRRSIRGRGPLKATDLLLGLLLAIFCLTRMSGCYRGKRSKSTA